MIKHKLLKFYSKSDSNWRITKLEVHEAKSADLGAVIYEWFQTRWNYGITVSGPVLRAKAKELHGELKVGRSCDFSSGWLKKFKKRYGINYIKAIKNILQKIKLSAYREPAEDFIDEFYSLVAAENLTPEQVLNMDETDLSWRCLPWVLHICDLWRKSSIKSKVS